MTDRLAKLEWQMVRLGAVATAQARAVAAGRSLVVGDRARIARFAITGASITFLNVMLLWFLNAKLGVQYLAASVLAYSASLLCNFVLQKVCTFRNFGGNKLRTELSLFVALNLCNLALNTALLFGLVEWFRLWYISGQLISSAIIAAESYYVYRWIFRQRQPAVR